MRVNYDIRTLLCAVGSGSGFYELEPFVVRITSLLIGFEVLYTMARILMRSLFPQLLFNSNL